MRFFDKMAEKKEEIRMRKFKSIDPSEIDGNVFKKVGEEWMLVTAGTPGKFNTMTASWGAFGVLWGMKVGICFVRPTRYTFGFIEASENYTLSFFPEEYRKALSYLRKIFRPRCR